jgi:hypothetical protein
MADLLFLHILETYTASLPHQQFALCVDYQGNIPGRCEDYYNVPVSPEWLRDTVRLAGDLILNKTSPSLEENNRIAAELAQFQAEERLNAVFEAPIGRYLWVPFQPRWCGKLCCQPHPAARGTELNNTGEWYKR